MVLELDYEKELRNYLTASAEFDAVGLAFRNNIKKMKKTEFENTLRVAEGNLKKNWGAYGFNYTKEKMNIFYALKLTGKIDEQKEKEFEELVRKVFNEVYISMFLNTLGENYNHKN